MWRNHGQVDPRTLLAAMEGIARTLAELVVSSVSNDTITCEVLEDGTAANVPLLKKGCTDNPGNYRQVNVTSVERTLLKAFRETGIFCI